MNLFNKRRVIGGLLGIALMCAANVADAADLTTVTFSGVSGNVVNPERGYTAGWDLSWNPSSERSSGRSLLRSFVVLPTSGALSSGFLSTLNSQLATVRAAHMKTTLRFKYNSGGNYPNCPEAPLSTALNQIAQLGPTLRANGDVIALQEAGIIGCWGEWSGTTAMTQSTSAKQQVMAALHAALPSRPVVMRDPMEKAAIYNAPNPMTSSDAYGSSDRDKTGYYNDCILSTQNGQDFTYPPSAIGFWTNYVQTETQWTPMGGESCGLTANVPNGQIAASACVQFGGQAQTQLAANHFSYMNYQDIVQSDWQAQGCFAEIGANLGYRLSLTSVDYTTLPAAGGLLHLNINLKNTGYAAIFNPRPFYAVLDGNGERFNLPLNADPRTWGSGANQSLSLDVPLPTSIPSGTYRLSLWLPDAAANLQNDPLYAIQFANSEKWDATTGLNVLANSIHVAGGGHTTHTSPSITSTSPLQTGTAGTPYSLTVNSSGSAPMTWTVTSGALPSGLALNLSSGVISGTPSTAASSSFTVAASNSAGFSSRQFRLTINAKSAKSWYNFVSRNSGKCLDVTGMSTHAGVQLQQWSCTGGANQKFSFTAVPGGQEITVQNSGLQLDVRGGESFIKNGTPIIQWPYWGGTNEIWKLSAMSGGAHTMAALSSRKCMDVSGSSLENGARIVQSTCSGSSSQNWRLLPAE